MMDDGNLYGEEDSVSSDMRMLVPTPATKALVMDRNVKNDDHFKGDFRMEDSPSYEILQKQNLLTKKYRVANENALEMTPPNSTRLHNTIMCCLTLPVCCIYHGFEVPNGSIKTAYDGRGKFLFFGPGVHQIIDPYFTVSRGTLPITTPSIKIGDKTIVTVEQGYVGYCMERGQPILLPPGMHQWQSQTLTFIRLIDLNQPVIEIGPWTLLTIDQGYMAVTQDNGKQVILDGGSVYLLTHRNWKFEKFVSTKIQTDELKRIEAASADNVIMLVDATVLWRISDVETAVRMSAETMTSTDQRATQTIVKLRNDVLKQAEASLAFFVGTINFSDSMAAAAMNQRNKETSDTLALATIEESSVAASVDSANLGVGGSGDTVTSEKNSLPAAQASVEFNLYDSEKLDDAVSHANDITRTYGVEIISINIISAIPGDKKLQASLAAGAVAAAEAQMMETTARGKSRAMQIEATATAKRTMILAKASADAEIVRAEGAKHAADLLATNPVSVELAKIGKTGDVLAGKGNHASFFFGADARDVQSLLANSSIVK